MSKGYSGLFKGTMGEHTLLIQELEESGTKFSEKDMVFVTRDSTGQIVWLEKGNSATGLEHITKRHARDFALEHNVKEKDINSHLHNVFSSGKVEYSRKIFRKGKLGYERLYNYKGSYYLLSGVGENGYIVSAYPIDESTAKKLIGRYKK